MDLRRTALLEAPHPESVTWNQMAYELTSEWYIPYNSSMISITFGDALATVTWLQAGKNGYNCVLLTPSSKNGNYGKPGDKVYFSYMLLPSFAADWSVEIASAIEPGISFPANQWSRYRVITTISGSGTSQKAIRPYFPNLRTTNSAVGDTATVKAPIYINLTTMFGAGNEPTDIDAFEDELRLNGIALDEYHERDYPGTAKNWWRWR